MYRWMFSLFLITWTPALAQAPADDEHLGLDEGAEPTEVATPAPSACEATCRATHAACRSTCLDQAPGSPAEADFREEVEVCTEPCGEAASACLAGCPGP